MAEAAFILELLAGIFFVIAAVPLLLLAARNRQIPERILGIAFLLMGVSYLFYETPFAFGNEALIVPFSLVGRLLWNASVVTTAAFTWTVFHREESWAVPLLWSVVVLLIAGLAISVQHGDLEGMAPIRNPGFWFEWVGQLIPFVWVSVASLTSYTSARRRARIGLSDALVSNRYLLFGGFGLLQLATVVLLVPMYIGYEVGSGGFSDSMDQLMGSLEMLTIVMIWLAFFPPRAYRDWIERAAARTATAR
ncbi:MAG: hypothetical protein JRE43_11710 [Deltaproteobacteria bacterium]|nr:hypothetical protein [Deltaproteobacteria bacterium]